MAETRGFDTLKIHGGYDSGEHNRSVQVPIYQTAAFDLCEVERALRLFGYAEVGFTYSRIANPTVAAFEKRVAALDGATGAVALSSGMAAISYAILTVSEGGGRVLTSPLLYGGTADGFKKIYPAFGVKIDYPDDAEDPSAYEAAIRPDTRAIYVESISNPNAVLLDIDAIAKVAHSHGIPLIVDNTFATPYLYRALEHGADIAVYSATKQLNGHGNVIAGIITEAGHFDWGNGKFPQFTEKHFTYRDIADDRERSVLEVFPDNPFTARIRSTYLNYLGAALGPFDAYLALIGLETLSERLDKQRANTLKLIRYLEHRPEVAWVSHPAATGSRYRPLLERDFPKGAGSIFTFGFRGTEAQSFRFLNAVKLFGFLANVGDARSLIINAPKTTHGELTEEELARAGILPETIRVSVGLEDADDLIADLDQAFEKAFTD